MADRRFRPGFETDMRAVAEPFVEYDERGNRRDFVGRDVVAQRRTSGLELEKISH